MKLIHDDGKFGILLYKPAGQHLHQGSLVRGDGVWERKGCAHDQGLRRFTSMTFGTIGAHGYTFHDLTWCVPAIRGNKSVHQPFWCNFRRGEN